jgi:transcriptional regulator with XRE-family HTH domain
MSYHVTVPAWAIVREARERAELTQRQLAERADKAQSEIAKIERGRRDPTFSTLERLVRAAGFDLRIQLVPHDDHDEQLIRAMRELSPDERLASLEEQLEFLAEAQLADRGSG